MIGPLYCRPELLQAQATYMLMMELINTNGVLEELLGRLRQNAEGTQQKSVRARCEGYQNTHL